VKLSEKWTRAVRANGSILCAGLDPAEPEQGRSPSLPKGASKVDWSIRFVEKIAPFCAAVKINRNYIKDLSRDETRRLVKKIHDHGMIAIDDSKLADIGDTNDSGFYHAAAEGFDAVTYAPFPGNVAEAAKQAHAHGVGLIVLVVMSNPEFEAIKNAKFGSKKGYEYFSEQVRSADADGVVLGAPSEKNRIREEELREVRSIVGDRLVLMPGIGAQGGEAGPLLRLFGDRVIANVGRAILYAPKPEDEARKMQQLLDGLRSKADVK